MTESQEPLAALLRRVVGRVEETVAGEERLRALLDAVTAIGGDLDVPSTLKRIVEAAATLAGARYAALGVLDVDGSGLSEFVTHGFDEETIRKVGAPPTGHGVLGTLITEPEPLRLHDIRDHTASIGFPENHPPMTTFLGVPIRIRDRIFGNLYLTEKRGGGDFSVEDENAIIALATTAGVAISNAAMYGEAQRRERWLAATSQIQRALLGNPPLAEALALVASHAREVTDATSSLIVLEDSDGELAVEAVAGLPWDLVGTHLERRASLLDVVERGISAELRDGLLIAGTTEIPRALMVPFSGPDGSAGALIVSPPEEHARQPQVDEMTALSGFAYQAAIALNLAQAREDRSSLAILGERDRIARDLHDVVIQRLFATGLTLQGVARHTGSPDVAEKVNNAVTELDATIRDIRTTIFELSRSDSSADLRAQISDVVTAAQASLKLRPNLTLEGPIETLVPHHVRPHLIAILIEGLSNVGRHADATNVDVTVSIAETTAGRWLRVVIRDDGKGFTGDAARSGLANIKDRAEGLDGSIEITSAEGEGTRVVWSVPLGL